MPIYEYGCTECGCKFEKLILSASRERHLRCPECGSANIEKAISLCGAVGGSSNAATASAASCAPSG